MRRRTVPDLRGHVTLPRHLAGDARYAPVKREQARWLPRINRRPVPGGSARLIEPDQPSGAYSTL